jgi:hypothetical protein
MAKMPIVCLTVVQSPNGSPVAFRPTVEAVARRPEWLRERRSRTGLVDVERKRGQAGSLPWGWSAERNDDENQRARPWSKFIEALDIGFKHPCQYKI